MIFCTLPTRPNTCISTFWSTGYVHEVTVTLIDALGAGACCAYWYCGMWWCWAITGPLPRLALIGCTARPPDKCMKPLLRYFFGWGFPT